ncbi:hypothetical protein FisN_14Lh207 [Fistulifera solaris]|uniref:FHA domain-containing protein n=1 Tax=Fistulifera solaris TaxID=1519565 RepID=A0A1Z5J9X7_FISSO|nr:hypothetical protein FisN_14Lh207 [Fistulifera solaris]|eukprot:GAX10692.1 hypothetical protein FisN_14Lh207 [Fistulifera solaris]
MTSTLLNDVPFPTGKSTVEDALNFVLQQALAKTDKKAEMALKVLQQELEDGVRELYNCHEQMVENCENSKPSTEAKDKKGASHKDTLKIDIISGEHAGSSFFVTPKPNKPCLLGRSKGKKFKQNGVSLCHDLEVSTTHGKFTVENGTFYFTDTGSSNGTLIRDEDVQVDVPYPLEDGIEMKVGQSILKVTFVSQ